MEVVIADDETVAEFAAEVRRAVEEQGAEVGWSYAQTGEGVLVQREAASKMAEHGGGVLPDEVEQEPLSGLKQGFDGSSALDAKGDGGGIEGGLLDPGEEDAGGDGVAGDGEDEAAAGDSPQGGRDVRGGQGGLKRVVHVVVRAAKPLRRVAHPEGIMHESP